MGGRVGGEDCCQQGSTFWPWTHQAPHLWRERAQRRQVLDRQHAFLGWESAAAGGARVRRATWAAAAWRCRQHLRTRSTHARTAEMLRSSKKASSDTWSSWSLMRKSNGVGLSVRRKVRRGQSVRAKSGRPGTAVNTQGRTQLEERVDDLGQSEAGEARRHRKGVGRHPERGRHASRQPQRHLLLLPLAARHGS